MANQIITDYLGQGLLANRPVAPDLVSGASALYFATDTEALYVWTGTEWKDASGGGGGGGPAVVQRKIGAPANLSDGLSLDNAPTEGNLLVAFAVTVGSAPPSSDTGWTRPFSNTSRPDASIFLKPAGDSESATQTPTTDTNPGVLAIYEVSGAAWAVETGVTLPTSTSSPTINIPDAIPILKTTLVLGCFARDDATLPASVTGATPDLDVTDGGIPMHMQTWFVIAAAGSTPSVIGSYGSSSATRRMYASIV